MPHWRGVLAALDPRGLLLRVPLDVPAVLHSSSEFNGRPERRKDRGSDWDACPTRPRRVPVLRAGGGSGEQPSGCRKAPADPQRRNHDSVRPPPRGRVWHAPCVPKPEELWSCRKECRQPAARQEGGAAPDPDWLRHGAAPPRPGRPVPSRLRPPRPRRWVPAPPPAPAPAPAWPPAPVSAPRAGVGPAGRGGGGAPAGAGGLPLLAALLQVPIRPSWPRAGFPTARRPAR